MGFAETGGRSLHKGIIGKISACGFIAEATLHSITVYVWYMPQPVLPVLDMLERQRKDLLDVVVIQ